MNECLTYSIDSDLLQDAENHKSKENRVRKILQAKRL